ncbi:MAG: hypothetical protein HUJ29_00600 [Gammaproteobacteria bacterium]|nr:hypothetical protein [Gammaproteobacteria bacterium]
MKAGLVEYPYIWWVYPGRYEERTMFEDASHIHYVKHENYWEPVLSLGQAGALVGSQSGHVPYEDVPKNGYFMPLYYHNGMRSENRKI